jgi:ABC-2 type transport system permease protein
MVLVWLSFRRMVWSANTLMIAVPLAATGLLLAFLRPQLVQRWAEDPELTFDRFSDWFAIGVFALFLLPISALAYATTSLGGDREDRTLVFLLVRPIPRWLVLLGKYCATLPVVVGISVGSFWVYCRLAGPVGERAYELYLAPVFCMSAAYVSLFQLFAVCFRHATILALVYSLFMETVLGLMPGIVKRLAVSFYGRSMMYELGYAAGVGEPDPNWFVPLSAGSAAAALAGVALGGLLLGLIVFARREYRDLT